MAWSEGFDLYGLEMCGLPFTVYDVNLVKELERIPVIHLNRDKVQIIVHGYESSYVAGLKHQLTLFQQKASSIIGKRILNDMLERALDNSLRKYPEGVLMSEEMMNDLWAEMEKEIIPWIASRIGNRKL